MFRAARAKRVSGDLPDLRDGKDLSVTRTSGIKEWTGSRAGPDGMGFPGRKDTSGALVRNDSLYLNKTTLKTCIKQRLKCV